MAKFAGFVAACVSGIIFGSNFITIKQYDYGDGMYFQFIMAIGIWIGGLIFQIIISPQTQQFHPISLLSGVIWSLGNLCTVGIIKSIGLGLGFGIWCCIQLTIGWATGKWGLFGTAKDTVNIESLNYIGIVLCLSALPVFVMVKTETDGNNDKNGNIDNNADKKDSLIPSLSNTTGPALSNNNNGGIESEQTETPTDHIHVPHFKFNVYKTDDINDYEHTVNSQRNIFIKNIKDPKKKHGYEIEKEMIESWIDKFGGWERKFIGVLLCIIAGTCYGLMFTPVQYIINNNDSSLYSDNLYDYVFSTYNGILLSALIWFILYVLFTKNKPQVNKIGTFPAIVCGIVWSVGMACWFYAMSILGGETAYPIVSSLPQCVASLWGVFLYGEVKGIKNLLILTIAIAFALAGILCISISKY